MGFLNKLKKKFLKIDLVDEIPKRAPEPEIIYSSENIEISEVGYQEDIPINIESLLPFYNLNHIPMVERYTGEPKIMFFDEATYLNYLTKIALSEEITVDDLNLRIYKAEKYIFENILNNYERNILTKYYIDNPSVGEYHLTISYGMTISIQSKKNWILDRVGAVYLPFIKEHNEIARRIIDDLIKAFPHNDYDIADFYTGYASNTYRQCEKDTYHLELVAEYGLKAYALKDFWFNIWEREDYGIKLDFFWPTLCNVLRKLNRLDEAIEIATFAYEHNAYDNTKDGWKARLDKLKNARNKKIPIRE